MLYENVGPVSRLEIDAPEEGGIVVFRGRNGVGKSQLIEATKNVVDGKGALNKRHGSEKATVELCGAKVTFGKASRRSGKLDAVAIEGRFSVGALVDPNLKDLAAADRERIKAILGITGASASLEQFAELFNADEFAAIVPDDLESTDPIEIAQHVRRFAQQAARAEEASADREAGRVDSLMQQTEDIDLDGECDRGKLDAALDEAIQSAANLRARRNAGLERREEVDTAKQKLAELGDPPSVDEASSEVTRTRHEWRESCKEVARLAALLKEAENKSQDCEIAYEEAQREHQHAVEQNKSRKVLEDLIASASEDSYPTADQVAGAEKTVEAARSACEMGVTIRSARESLDKAREAEQTAAKHRDAATRLRRAAAGTDSVLSRIVSESGVPIIVDTDEHGTMRLKAKKQDGEFELFAELSHGERIRIALDIAIQSVGQGGLIPIEQELWQSLDHENIKAIARLAHENRVLIVTADCSRDESNDELHAEVIAASA